MPQPTRGDVHVVRSLTNISVAYLQAATDFVSMTAFPTVPVQFQSDKYFKFDSADFRRDNAKPRAPGTEAASGGFDLTTDTYSCEVYAIKKHIADQIRANTDAAVDIDRASSEWVTQQLLIQKERNWVTNFFTTSVWGTDKTGATDFTVWDDGASDPEADIDAGKAVIKKATGLSPNTFILGYEAHQALKRHPLVQERYKYTSPSSITTEMLARYLEVDRYLVAGASYTSSQEGAATATNAFIAGKHALLCYVAPSPGLMAPSAGYTFAWSAFSGSNGGLRIKRYRREELESDTVEGEFSYDHQVVLSECGYFFSGAVA